MKVIENQREDSGKDVVRILLDVIEGHGVRDVICSPGSRNAPLLIGLEARKNLRKRIIIDERSAAFIALGIARVSNRPVALVCTSGTALLNYAPAVAEAYYQGIPLTVISADRPLEWIDQDDSQTIRQPDSLRNIVKATYDLSDREAGDKKGWYENRIANDALLVATGDKPGPVHINVRLSPPLDERITSHSDPKTRIISRIPESVVPSRDLIKSLARRMAGKKVMIIAGFMPPSSRLNKGMQRIASHADICIMAETISNLHLKPEAYAIDAALCAADQATFASLRPDIIISLGGAIVSKMLKEYLRECGQKNPEMEHWAVGLNHTTVDCFQSLSLRIEIPAENLIGPLSAELAHILRNSPEIESTGYGKMWTHLKREGLKRNMRICDEASWSDLKAIRFVLDNLPGDANLFLSNGTCIRYAQIIQRRIPHAEFCNRGVSGIDGSSSTALGGDLAYKGQTVLLTGDMSLAYDMSLWPALVKEKSRLKIIVINNKGGGIFRFISSTARLPEREQYFCADPALPLKGICEAFGLPYFRSTSEDELNESFRAFLTSDGAALLEIITPAEESADLLRQLLRRK